MHSLSKSCPFSILGTIKEISGLPGLPLPAFYPVYPSKDQMADYYDACSSFFNVRTNTYVTSASYDPEAKQWTVRTRATKVTAAAQGVPSSASAPVLSASSSEQAGEVDIGEPTLEVFTSKALIVCTGSNGEPLMPDIPGRDQFTGQVLHASEYKNGKEFSEKKVLVVGADTTGAEIALDLWEYDARVGLVASTPGVILRRALIRPLLLFYPLSRLIPRVIRRRVYDVMAPYVLGKLSDYNLQLASLHKLRKTDPLPPIWLDVGTLDLVRQRDITVFNKDISTFIPNGVIFKDGREELFDAVILNTGFKKASFKTFLEPDVSKAGKDPFTGGRPSRQFGELIPLEGVEIAKKALYFVGISDAFFKLREDHYTCEQVHNDLTFKKYI